MLAKIILRLGYIDNSRKIWIWFQQRDQIRGKPPQGHLSRAKLSLPETLGNTLGGQRSKKYTRKASPKPEKYSPEIHYTAGNKHQAEANGQEEWYG